MLWSKAEGRLACSFVRFVTGYNWKCENKSTNILCLHWQSPWDERVYSSSTAWEITGKRRLPAQQIRRWPRTGSPALGWQIKPRESNQPQQRICGENLGLLPRSTSWHLCHLQHLKWMHGWAARPDQEPVFSLCTFHAPVKKCRG